MKKETAKRLYALESGWTACGSGFTGRNNGMNRNKKKARSHFTRLEKLRRLAGL